MLIHEREVYSRCIRSFNQERGSYLTADGDRSAGSVLLLGQRGEEHLADLGNRHCVHKLHACVESLRAHDPVFLGKHFEASETRVLRVLLIPVWQEVSLIDGDLALEVISALESFDLCEDLVLVCLDSFVNLAFDDINIAFTNLEDHRGLHQLDKALDEQLFDQLTIDVLILDLEIQLDLGSVQEALNCLVDLRHLVNADFVLLFREIDFSIDDSAF